MLILGIQLCILQAIKKRHIPASPVGDCFGKMDLLLVSLDM
jgi:hypothetical protein